MFVTMFLVFVFGYVLIAQEHVLKIDKAAIALIIGVAIWGFYILGAAEILPGNIRYQHFVEDNPVFMTQSHSSYIDFIAHHEIAEHLADISSILVFLMAAMTIVELIDCHEGFRIITDKIKTTDKVKLLWLLSFVSFIMSAALDNLTTTIVMITLLKKLVTDNKRRWFFASMIIIAANAGGAWSPIGDVTTIMLWIGGQVTATEIIKQLLLPCLVTITIPLLIVSFGVKGDVTRPRSDGESSKQNITTKKERQIVFYLGVFLLLMVPVLKTVIGLPPYMGMLGALGILWITTELMHKPKPAEYRNIFRVTTALKNVDFSSILFFLGILLAVAGLQSAGHLRILSGILDKDIHNIYAMNLIIGILSSVVDNVPLVAGAMGMYDVALPAAEGYQSFFAQNGSFWEFLAYCAGTGGSILIIGSAAGVVAMGMLKIDFMWYLKKISFLALIGYLAGAAVYYGMTFLI